MKVLLVGNGARENVIAESIVKSHYKPELYAVVSAKNPGIISLSKDVKLGDITDPGFVSKFALEKGIDFAVIGPEAPLEKGVTDALENNNIPCVGPLKSAAQLETNKGFAKLLMKKYNMSGLLNFEIFDDSGELERFIDSFGRPVVVKPLGLTGGKGVKIVDPNLDGQLKNLDQAKDYGKSIIENRTSGFGKVLVEEKVVGEEFTLQAFVDGKHVVGMPLVQDHKFAYPGDNGPFTGGMGSYSDSNHLLPFLSKTDYEKALNVMKEVVNAMRKQGMKYRGVLYGGFMLTKDGPKILEFNARFGDPEAMNVLPLLKTDFINICNAIIEQRLDRLRVEFLPMATVCKYAVPKGYPTNPVKNQKILIGAMPNNARIYYASVDQRTDGLYMTTSRAVACVGIADTIEKAEQIAESAMKNIKGPVFYRQDIGTKKLIQKRVEHIESIKSGEQ